VWTGVIECTYLAAMTGQGDALCPGLDRTNLSLAQRIHVRNPVPDLLRALLRCEVFFNNSTVRAVAQRWVGAALAKAKEVLAVFLRREPDRLEARTLV